MVRLIVRVFLPLISHPNLVLVILGRVAMDGDLLEYSVIYTDRAKNLMSGSFSKVSIFRPAIRSSSAILLMLIRLKAMKDISAELKDVYQAQECVIIPGSGTYAMEAVVGQYARHFIFLVHNMYYVCSVVSFAWWSFWLW